MCFRSALGLNEGNVDFERDRLLRTIRGHGVLRDRRRQLEASDLGFALDRLEISVPRGVGLKAPGVRVLRVIRFDTVEFDRCLEIIGAFCGRGRRILRERQN